MSWSNSIPFLDLVTPHVELEQELTAVSVGHPLRQASLAARWSRTSKRHLLLSVMPSHSHRGQ